MQGDTEIAESAKSKNISHKVEYGEPFKQAGLIKDSQKPCDGVTSTGLTLTSEGLQVASNKKQVILELWQKLFAGISEGAIRAMS